MVEPSNANAIKPVTNNNALKSDETLYYLDLSNPSIRQPIEPTTDNVETARFVQVEVAEVLNPKKYALTFEVHYQSESNTKIYLGTFSLYPADNPGKFIVPTQGNVKKEGAIVLSLVMVDKVDVTAPVKVGVKRIKFLKEQ
ncbi:MAG: hypothetical protein ND895_27510 [Pyrinomonadaceae bacterium]|nr:hypothetical protein [Pyrinomonadaceae bacterium]